MTRSALFALAALLSFLYYRYRIAAAERRREIAPPDALPGAP